MYLPPPRFYKLEHEIESEILSRWSGLSIKEFKNRNSYVGHLRLILAQLFSVPLTVSLRILALLVS